MVFLGEAHHIVKDGPVPLHDAATVLNRRRGPRIQSYTAAGLSADPAFLHDLVRTYRDIFGAEPWNEWKVCPSCRTTYGRLEYETRGSNWCGRCGLGALVDYHAPEQVVERLYAELGMSHGSPFMFTAQPANPSSVGRVLGFTWGFGLPMEQVVTHILRHYFTDLPERLARHAEARILHGLAACCPSGNATYISEVAVAEGARGSSMLFAQMLHAMAERQVANGYPTWVLWTSRKSRAYQLAALLGGAPLYHLDEDVKGDHRLLIAGDCAEFLAIREKYPAEKLVSYFVKTVRDLKAAAK